MTKEEAFKQFCDEIAKEAPQYAEMMRENCIVVGAFNRGWEDSQKNSIDKACKNVELLLNAMKTYDNKDALLAEFRKSLEE